MQQISFYNLRKQYISLLCFLLLFLSTNISYAQLPIVRLTTTKLSPSIFYDGHISIDNELSLGADIRYRGASSLNRQKKSFAVKLKDINGEKCDTSLLGMRKDNYWILDAMAIDMARMRNRVSMELWNDFSRKSYVAEYNKKTRNSTDGRFVELYLNDEYWGIYCLSERLDRKQLKLKKFDEEGMKGVIYKSTGTSSLYSRDANYYIFDNNLAKWNNWELAYPDIDDGEPIDWQPLADIIYWLSYSSTREIADQMTRKIDTPVWQDYFLLMEFICGEDNITKNQYVYYYDATDENRMLGVAPWDMDHSWGRDWRGEIVPTTSPNTKIWTTNNRVGTLLINNERILDKTYEERYAELRDSYFSAEKLVNRFNTYFKLFYESGAAQRETDRWNGADGYVIDFEKEQEYIHDWIIKRIAYMDAKYNYSADHITNTFSEYPSSDYIYNLNGQCMGEFNSMTAKPEGIYIINGKKYIKK